MSTVVRIEMRVSAVEFPRFVIYSLYVLTLLLLDSWEVALGKVLREENFFGVELGCLVK